MNHRQYTTVFFSLILSFSLCLAQQSDYAVKKSFETNHKIIKTALDEAHLLAQLDSLANKIVRFENQYRDQKDFLSKALYPETYETLIADLRTRHAIALRRISLSSTQTSRILELETAVSSLTGRLDSLNAERNMLFAELRAMQKSHESLKHTVKRLQNTLAAKDQLIFALIDSIFLSHSQPVDQISEVQRDALTRKLEQSNVVDRVHEIVNDNVRFVGLTQLQGNDYASLLEHHQQFKVRWMALREKINEAIDTDIKPARARKAQKTESGVALVNSSITQWEAKLRSSFWTALEKEFSGRGLTLKKFSDGESFYKSIHAYTELARQGREDVSTFVDDIWIGRIDKEWKPALTKPSVLGQTQYASLHTLVTQLREKKLDWKLLFFIANVGAVILVGWYLLGRKSRSKASQDQEHDEQ